MITSLDNRLKSEDIGAAATEDERRGNHGLECWYHRAVVDSMYMSVTATRRRSVMLRQGRRSKRRYPG